MPDAATIARALCQGWIDAPEYPELTEPDTQADVRRRLEEVGHRLQQAGRFWLAAPTEQIGGPALSARLEFGETERAVLAALYLHLIFLPSEHGRDPLDERESVSAEELVDTLRRRGLRKQQAEAAVRNVCAAGFARRVDGRLHAGPPLAALDASELHERVAVRLMRERIDRLRPGVQS